MRLKKLKKKWIERENYVPRLKVNNYVFYRELDVSKEEIRYDDWRKGFFNKENLVRDIEEEFKINGASDRVPPYQTKDKFI